MGKITLDSNEDSIKRSMIEREAKMNPASVEPGMDDEWGSSGGDDGWGSGGGSDDSWGSGGGSDDGWGSSGGSGGWGDSSGGSGWGDSSGGGWGASGSVTQTPPQPNMEDKVFDGLATGAKGVGKFVKEIIGSFKTFDVVKKVKMGYYCVIMSSIGAVSGLVILLFGKEFGISLLVGSLLSLGVGVVLTLFNHDELEERGLADQLNNTNNSSRDSDDSMEDQKSDMDSWLDDEDSWGNDGNSDDEDEVDAFETDDDDDDDIWGDSPDSNYEYEEVDETPPDKDSILDKIEEGNNLVTKSYLYEKISEYIPYNKPDFGDEKDLDGTRVFELLCNAVTQSGEQLKTGKQEDDPYLISATDKLFYIHLEVQRVKWLKNVNTFIDEIVKIYRYNSELGRGREGIYGIGEAVGDRIYIKIMKGETAMVTVNDIYKSVPNDIKGSKHKMPIVIGIDIEGEPVVQDFWSINSILVTGMPRSGKSWFVQVVLAQMMFYMSPVDLNFYIFDPKGDISDFRDMTMPHVRKFVSTEKNMLNELRNIVKVEGPRRKKILGDAGFVNINDFKKKHPDVELPILYIMIDEVVTLAENMDKETKDEFQSLLLILVSQLPALGIRIIMVPHVVKDQVIKKSTTDLIPCRISVRGDASHIESSTGTKEKDFNQKLTHQGDMAVRFNNDPTKFVHSAILTTSNEGNSDLFDFLTKLWCKIEPNSYKGSYAEQKQTGLMYKNSDLDLVSNKGVTSQSVSTVSSNSEPVPKRKVSINMDKVIDETDVHKLLDGIHADTTEEASSYEELEDFWR